MIFTKSDANYAKRTVIILILKILGANLWSSLTIEIISQDNNFWKHVAKYYLIAYIT